MRKPFLKRYKHEEIEVRVVSTKLNTDIEDKKLASSITNLVLLPSNNNATDFATKQLDKLFDMPNIPDEFSINVLAMESYKYIEKQIKEVIEPASKYLAGQAYYQLYSIMNFYINGGLPTKEVQDTANELLSYF